MSGDCEGFSIDMLACKDSVIATMRLHEDGYKKDIKKLKNKIKTLDTKVKMLNYWNASKYHVYIVATESEKAFKIGVTNNIKKRMSTISTNTPYKLLFVVYLYVPSKKCAFVLEKHLHEQFAEYRTNGEWFMGYDGLHDFLCNEINEYGRSEILWLDKKSVKDE
jgi:hypothetical protein